MSRYLGYAHRFLMALLGFYYLDTNFISIYGWDAWGFSGPYCHYRDVEAELCPVGRYWRQHHPKICRQNRSGDSIFLSFTAVCVVGGGGDNVIGAAATNEVWGVGQQLVWGKVHEPSCPNACFPDSSWQHQDSKTSFLSSQPGFFCLFWVTLGYWENSKSKRLFHYSPDSNGPWAQTMPQEWGISPLV